MISLQDCLYMLCPPVSSYLWPLFSRPCLPSTKCWLKPGRGPRPQPQTLIYGGFSPSTSLWLHTISRSLCGRTTLPGGSALLSSVSEFPVLPYTPAFPRYGAAVQTVISTGMVFCAPHPTTHLTFTGPVGSFASFSAWLRFSGSPFAA